MLRGPAMRWNIVDALVLFQMPVLPHPVGDGARLGGGPGDHGSSLLKRVYIQEIQNVLTLCFRRLTTEVEFCGGPCVPDPGLRVWRAPSRHRLA